MAELGSLFVNVGANIRDFERKMSKVSKTLDKQGKRMQDIGGAMTRNLTLPLGAAGIAAVKFAADFESSFANVRKTVNATESQFQAMQKEFRQMSKEIPVSVNELNRLAGVAGQLGVEAENIPKFTRVIADLGATTNIEGEQAALSLSRLMNIMGTAQDDIDRMGATIVDLGNNFAAQESEIVEMSQSLAAFGSSVGLSEQQVLAFSTTIAASGGKLQAAGTAFQKVANQMQTAVITGNEDLSKFAEIAGVSAEEFQKRFEEDAGAAITDFLKGLRKIRDAGGSTSAALEELGLADQRLIREFGKVIGNLDQLDQSLAVANKAWDENTALTDEAQKRYSTFSSQMTILMNRLKDVGITIGNILIPIVEKMLGFVQMAVSAFEGLGRETQTMIVAIGGLAAAAGPVIFAFGKIASIVGTMIPVLAKVLTFLNPVTAALALTAGAIITQWDKVSSFFSGEFLETLGSVASKIGQITTKIASLFEGAGSVISDVWNVISGILVGNIINVFKFILNLLDTFLGSFLDAIDMWSSIFTGDWRGAWDAVLSIVSRVGKLLIKTLQNIIGFAGKWVSKFVGLFSEDAQKGMEDLLDGVDDFGDDLVDSLDKNINDNDDAQIDWDFTFNLPGLGSAAKDVEDKLNDVERKVLKFAQPKSGLDTSGLRTGAVATDAVKRQLDAVDELGKKMDQFNDKMKDLQKGIATTASVFTQHMGQIGGAIQSLFTGDLLGAGLQFFDTMVAKSQEMLDAARSDVQSIGAELDGIRAEFGIEDASDFDEKIKRLEQSKKAFQNKGQRGDAQRVQEDIDALKAAKSKFEKLQTEREEAQERLNEQVNGAAGFFEKLNGMLDELLTDLMPAFNDLFEALQPLIPIIKDFADVLVKNMSRSMENLKILLDTILPILEPLLGLMGELMSITGALAPVFKTMMEALQPIIDILVDVLKVNMDFLGFQIGLIADLFELLAPLIELAFKPLELVAKGLKKLLQVLGLVDNEVSGPGIEGATETGTGIVDAATKVAASTGQDVAKVFEDLARAAADKAGMGFKEFLKANGLFDFAKNLGVPGLATGTNMVPKNMLAMLHKGEAVVPKKFNPAAGGSGMMGGRIEVSGILRGDGDELIAVIDRAKLKNDFR